MHTLHLIEVEDGNPFKRVRAVRSAMRALHVNAKAHHADAKIAEAAEQGAALLGVSEDPEVLEDVRAALELNGCIAVIDHSDMLTDDDAIATLDAIGEEDAMSPEERLAAATEANVAAEEEDERAVPASASVASDTTADKHVFSTESHETAMAAMAAMEGDPLKAAAHLHVLARVTGDPELYVEAINALIQVFPWIAKPLILSGLVDPDV